MSKPLSTLCHLMYFQAECWLSHGVLCRACSLPCAAVRCRMLSYMHPRSINDACLRLHPVPCQCTSQSVKQLPSCNSTTRTQNYGLPGDLWVLAFSHDVGGDYQRWQLAHRICMHRGARGRKWVNTVAAPMLVAGKRHIVRAAAHASGHIHQPVHASMCCT